MEVLLVDAYNVIHGLNRLSGYLDRSLEHARKALVDLMINWKRNRSYKGEIIVVFDGQDNIPFKEGSKSWGVKCNFTGSKQEADDWIIRYVRSYGGTKKITVISADNMVCNGCRIMGACVAAPGTLLEKKKKSTDIPELRSKEGLNGARERDVDEFYRRELGL